MYLFLCLVSLSNQVFLLLRRKVAPPKLILANPGKGFVAVAELLFMGAELNARMRLRDAVAMSLIFLPSLRYKNSGLPYTLIISYRNEFWRSFDSIDCDLPIFHPDSPITHFGNE